MLPIALASSRYEGFLREFQKEVSLNPNADFTPRIAALVAEFREQECKRISGAFFMLLMKLYKADIPTLKRDLLKIKLLSTARVTPSQRAELLQCICEIMSLYIDDFNRLIAMCEIAEAAYSMEGGSPAPDVLG